MYVCLCACVCVRNYMWLCQKKEEGGCVYRTDVYLGRIQPALAITFVLAMDPTMRETSATDTRGVSSDSDAAWYFSKGK